MEDLSKALAVNKSITNLNLSVFLLYDLVAIFLNVEYKRISMEEPQFKSLSTTLKRNKTLKHLKLNHVCSSYEPIYDDYWDDGPEDGDREYGMGFICKLMGKAVGSSCLESFSFCVFFLLNRLFCPLVRCNDSHTAFHLSRKTL